MDLFDAANLLDRKRPERTDELLSTGSFALDLSLGGGLRRGRIAELYGDYMTYKTTFALHAVRQAQALGQVLWVDSGEGFNQHHALSVGIEVNKVAVLAPADALQALTVMRDLSKEFRLMVVDSAAQLDVPEEGEPSWWDLEFAWLSEALRASNTTALFVNKLSIDRDNNFTRALRTAATQRVNTVPTSGRHVVQTVVTQNRAAPPFEFMALHRFDDYACIDANYETARMAVQVRVVEKHGSFFHFGERKFHGIPGFRDALDTDPQLVSEVKQAVTSAVRGG